MMNHSVLAAVLCVLCAAALAAAETSPTDAPEAKVNAGGVDWSRQLKADPGYFPIAVWMQDPAKAPQYKRMGVNLYINLWEGPTDEQLARLKAAGMEAFCEMKHDAEKNLDNPVIVGWLHLDEPDNAQKVVGPDGKVSYGPPITPAKVVEHYKHLKKIDPSRPIMINLGQGVAWENWKGRGVRTGKLKDYAEYLKGCDMASFDIYPVVHSNAEVAGKLEFVPKGVARLVKWSKGEKMIWVAIEGSRIGNVKVKPTPRQIRSEVWMAIIRGARGVVYFVHQFAPKFDASPILKDAEMYNGLSEVNAEIHSLAKVINSTGAEVKVDVVSANEATPVALMARRVDGATYIFAAAMRPGQTRATFTVPGVGGKDAVEVIGEDRKLDLARGVFEDNFNDYGVHLYKIE